MLVYYPYTPANHSDAPVLACIHLMYLASVNDLHPSLINHTDAHVSSADSKHEIDLSGQKKIVEVVGWKETIAFNDKCQQFSRPNHWSSF